ncbi:hypothetical protein SAMN04488502_101588 [Dendrosporobacter quercicolus]|uniref:UPF0235 protein SAMN04488502_101588 n=1 Tax=Dendrosporobacter quercicolus TaxID=146817 RepID=A0A1G9M7B8_9FIRM|nr:DUF167 domain-containing protein [Dendrosporobacter quercicolus]SDL69831.1 hypothetical protein SAMN04488502_101588 [Dendrosporobacter quercicolus]
MMVTTGLAIQQLPDGVSMKVRVQPRASRNKIAGMYADRLKVVLTSPPVDGEANQACIDFFAKLFAMPKNGVSILAGHKSRNKTIKLCGLDQAAVLAKLQAIADG